MVLKHRNSQGTSLLEYLIILAVIIILAAASGIFYRGSAEASKLAQATSDLETLARAEREVARAHGVYVPLQVLDDSTSAQSKGASQLSDDLAREADALKAVEVSVPADAQIGKQPSLKSKIVDWKGPFAQTKRVYIPVAADGKSSADRPDATTLRRNYPLDPWGHPYRFYSPAGLIGTAADKSDAEALNSDSFSDGVLTTNDPRFTRFAIVSFGPDGQSDSVSNNNDDVIKWIDSPGSSPSAKAQPEKAQ